MNVMIVGLLMLKLCLITAGQSLGGIGVFTWGNSFNGILLVNAVLKEMKVKKVKAG